MKLSPEGGAPRKPSGVQNATKASLVHRASPVIGSVSGVMKRYPNLHFIVSHLGGAIPCLAERTQNVYEAYPECRKHIP